jgi:hypothetical protein
MKKVYNSSLISSVTIVYKWQQFLITPSLIIDSVLSEHETALWDLNTYIYYRP